MNKPPIIDHDPHERLGRRYSLGKWWLAVWAMVAIFWLLQFRDGLDLEQICLGFLSGGILAIWAVDMHLSRGGSSRDL
ncbi:conserved hypothetical protein [Agrobacterium fabacearum S56]|jgi:hypothetical protein|uniref:hypothetical protein n=1 Tax=Agrobacterium tumefaciens TaxID=358 RepID=UPI0009BA2DEB|nr:hypothetical protein [Agrobacterium tumefaciens]CUW90175.1 conserved hypothetical protein [Agrobacterium fabacearum S56]